MILLSPHSSSSFLFCSPNSHHTSNTKTATFNNVSIRSDSSSTRNDSKESKKIINESSSCSSERFCFCGRRRFIESVGTALFPIHPSNASNLHPDDDPTAVLYRVHPPRPDWYEEFYASVLDTGMKAYEAEVADYKSQLFANLRGKANEILEIGIGTGPNLKYYATDTNVHVFGIDPNRKMEKYAQAAAEAAGLPPKNFKFMHAVAEALPFSDASVDAVVGTLVLCSVKDVDLTLQDGTFLRLVQGVLDPLQQKVSDGCHLTRKTGKSISEAGFSGVDINMAFLSTASLIGPHVYGIACK